MYALTRIEGKTERDYGEDNDNPVYQYLPTGEKGDELKPLPFVCAHCMVIYNRITDFRIDAWGSELASAVDDYRQTLRFKNRGTS